MTQSSADNAQTLQRELAWLESIIEWRIALLSSDVPATESFDSLPPPDVQKATGPYAERIRKLALTPAQRLILILALAPHIAPYTLDPFSLHNPALARPFTEFGGQPVSGSNGILPTGDTVLFLLGGTTLTDRLNHIDLFDLEQVLFSDFILSPLSAGEGPLTAQTLVPTPEAIAELIRGTDYSPPFSNEFPAQRLTTGLEWDDLVVHPQVLAQLQHIADWITHEPMVRQQWGLNNHISPGYRSLFTGPPGTGKTLSASLLGKSVGMPVFRIDLSQTISKYIGETEKNIANLFDRAHSKRWILFFDEADSLFGSRTEASSASDRAANQNVAYLLQRIEMFDGVSLLATNLKSNIDEAFFRRFQSVISFIRPDVEQRLRLWQLNFDDKPFALGDNVDLFSLAQQFDITGGEINNVLRMACLRVAARGEQTMTQSDILTATREEMRKSGRFA